MKPSDRFQTKDWQREFEVEKHRLRYTILAAAVLSIAALVSIVLYVILVFKTNAWQIYVLAAGSLFLAIVGGLAIVLCRRGRQILAAWLLIAGLAIAVINVAWLSSGSGLAIGLAGLVVILVIAMLVLPQQQVRWAGLLGVATGMGAGLLDFAAPGYQVYLVSLVRILPIIAVVVLAVLALIIAFQFRSLNLTNKFIIIFLVLTLIIAGTIGYMTQRNMQVALTGNVGNRLNDIANSQAQAIGDQLAKQIELLFALSINKNLVDALNQANVQYIGDEAAIRSEIALLDEQWRGAFEGQNKLTPLVQERINNETARQLKEYKRTYIDQVEVFVTDRYGALVATTDVTSDYYQADEAWWQGAYNNGKGGYYFSPPVYDESAGVLSVQIAVPVRDYETPEVVGVLRTTYRFAALDNILNQVFLGSTGETDLMFPDEDFKFYHLHESGVSPVEPDVMLQLADYRLNNYAEFEYAGNQSFVSQAQVLAESDTSLAYETDIANLGWWVVVHQASQEALQPVQEQTRATLLLVVAIVGMAAAVAVWLAGALARPIVHLTGVAEHVREGDLAARAPVESSDEIGQLASTFNEMTARLRRSLEGLEQRVNERTRELTLSGEVGRTLSQERDLDRLLKSAVELIESSFDLYYTQIYLVDTSGKVLVLRSGTGSVGEELLNRAHRLPVSLGSINGLAAAERHPVIVADTETSAIFRPNPLLPATRSEMAMPLMVGERVVGVLDMQSQHPGALSEDLLPAFEALAGQLAVAVENASLFDQAQRAQAEMESQARRLTRQGWSEFLDAIEHSERIGFIYDRAEMKPTGDALKMGKEGTLFAPIQVTGETVGGIQLEREAAQGWTSDESELVVTVAAQVARQVENLRLLARAERYRAEAEDAIRRLTRQGWEEYLDELGGREVAFVYDQAQVQPANEDLVGEQQTHLTFPLTVHEEMIGELVFGGNGGLGEDALEVVNQVAESLSTHLENLRLNAQTQVALARTDALYSISASLNEASEEDEILQVMSRPAIEAGVFSTNLVYLDLDEHGKPEWAELIAAWPPEGAHAVSVGTRFYLPQMPFTRLWVANPDEPLLVSNVNTDERVDEYTRAAMAQGGSRAIAIIPLTRAGIRVGLIIFNWDSPHEFSQQEMETYRSLIGLGSPAVQNRRLFVQTQARARQEQILRQVTERVRGSTDPDTVLRTAVRELGTVLGRNVLIRLGSQRELEEELDDGDGKQ